VKTLKVALATLILIGGIWINLNPGITDSRYDFDDNDDSTKLLGLQEDEDWLILRVAFPSLPYSESESSSLLFGEDSAQEYISQLSGGTSNLNVTITDEIWVSEFEESYWGADSQDERDVGISGNGIEKLVEESCISLLSDMDLSNWDIDDDGTIDRLLILHSGNAQESGGSSDSIWSHFSTLTTPLEIGKWEINHYTISSIDSGLGTLVHEMLHQMGAYDLYDVHTDLPSSSWNGLGDWDIMASGNWNGNARSPALAGAATLMTIGAPGIQEIYPNNFQNLTIYPMDSLQNKTRVLSINTAPGESVLISYRADSGFDSELPGSGIIVEYLDLNNGNVNENTVNRDPKNPWVMIIEADGDQALVRNRDSGSEGDPFQSGDTFGSSGHMIRDNRGRLIPLEFTVTHIGLDKATIEIRPNENFTERILTPRSPLQLIEGETAFATIITEYPCTLVMNTSNDLTISEPVEIEIPSGNTMVPIIHHSELEGKIGVLKGHIGCMGENPEDISIEWQSIGHRIDEQKLEYVVPWDRDSSIALPIMLTGSESRSYDIVIEGAVSRIATSETQGEFSPGDEIILSIEPQSLLTPGMYARGEIIFQDDFSVEQRIELTLIAESPFTGDGILGWLSQPSNGLLVISVLLAFSILIGRDSSD
tara:strand:- start:68 stop:2020 length:1953 start_codon:yes stop_codon:yes gene_type:complete